MLEDISSLYAEMERGLQVPLQFTLTQVCMLPKSEPISLTHVFWRAWCRQSRWNLLQSWTTSYQGQAPWDAAVPGSTSLDVGLRRVMWAESSRIQSKCFIGLFVDISGFYDSVLWDSVIEEGLRLSFPPMLLELALQIYSGYRFLAAEDSVSPGILPCAGLLQGCPPAPAISKLALYAPIKQIVDGRLAHHVDQWLDDISADIAPCSATVR